MVHFRLVLLNNLLQRCNLEDSRETGALFSTRFRFFLPPAIPVFFASPQPAPRRIGEHIYLWED